MCANIQSVVQFAYYLLACSNLFDILRFVGLILSFFYYNRDVIPIWTYTCVKQNNVIDPHRCYWANKEVSK